MENKKKVCRAASVLLSLLLSISLMPAGAFAQDLPENDLQNDAQTEMTEEQQKSDGEEAQQAEEPQAEVPQTETQQEQAAAEEEVRSEEPQTEEEPVVSVQEVEAAAEEEGDAEVDPYPQGKSFKLDNNKVKFKSAVVMAPPSYMSNSKIDHVWLTAGKKYMTVKWNDAANMTYVDGVIILRRTGKSSVYNEVKRIQFKTYEGDTPVYNLKNSFKDTTAKKKNTPYRYIAVTYYVKDGLTFISHVSDWAAGQTKASTLKTVNKAKISKTSVKLQYGAKATVKLTYAKPKTTYNAKSFRWYSDNKKVAVVNKKGKITAKAPGTTTIRGRLSSGNDVTCTVKVIGAFKPGTPKLKVDVADSSSISLVWSKAKRATSYDLYKSNDGLHWKKYANVKGTSKKVTGLTKNHRYTFYVMARNDNGPYSTVGNNSNVINQKAVLRLRPTAVTGFPKTKTLKAGNTFTLKLKITNPEHRKLYLQMKKGKTWVTKKTVTLPKGTGKKSFSLQFPSDWWNGTTSWRLYVAANKTAAAYTSGNLKITATRQYQNPASYVQIKNSISKHGYSYYVSPVLVNNTSTKADHIEALITTAAKYKGTNYYQAACGSPGKNIDESGLVMQACYGAGVDLWPISPATRPGNCVPKIMSAKLAKVTYKKPASETSNDYPTLVRGDLIFFAEKGSDTPDIVAIYTGFGKLLFADKVKGAVGTSTIRKLEDKSGKYVYHVVGARRIFN